MKLWLLLLSCMVLFAVPVFADHPPICTINNPYVFETNTSTVISNATIPCSDAHGLYAFNVSCDNAYIYNSNLAGATSFTFNLTTTLYAPTTICNLSIADNQETFTNTIVLNKVYHNGGKVFIVNSCPDDVAGVILYIGLLFFFTTIVIMCAYFRMGLVGLFGSIAIIIYALFITGCYALFGWIFAAIGIMLFLYFAMGKYS